MAKKWIISFIDFCYPPFSRIMPLQTFRYAACGSSNTVLGFAIYSIAWKFIFREQVFKIGFLALTPYVASLILAFLVNFPTGFLLMKYVVFIDSTIRGRIQLFRYLFVFVANLFLNYLLLKTFVELLHFNAIIAQLISTAIVIGVSYLLQRHFTFKVEKAEAEQ
jgi:putative flippase GtrA